MKIDVGAFIQKQYMVIALFKKYARADYIVSIHDFVVFKC